MLIIMLIVHRWPALCFDDGINQIISEGDNTYKKSITWTCVLSFKCEKSNRIGCQQMRNFNLTVNCETVMMNVKSHINIDDNIIENKIIPSVRCLICEEAATCLQNLFIHLCDKPKYLFVKFTQSIDINKYDSIDVVCTKTRSFFSFKLHCIFVITDESKIHLLIRKDTKLFSLNENTSTFIELPAVQFSKVQNAAKHLMLVYTNGFFYRVIGKILKSIV
ncbi:unnamed protein product [Didymodactylos carnosus]|uniref:Uncharacterized protein n=1 Tax=Didymodactylos carnosus TaxID=1234261 RepID=A0A8S2I4H0_9BILA|nr:unnamed protein product [Didymodactylos carnosus]CAF3708024.1 unnamed protein product [Didymodactylos carnosus]